jgi:hypothetical protein
MSGARRIGGDPCETPTPHSFDCQFGPLWVSQIYFSDLLADLARRVGVFLRVGGGRV